MSTPKKKPTRETVRYARARVEEIFTRERNRIEAEAQQMKGQLAKLKSSTMDMLVLPDGTEELKDILDTFERQAGEFEVTSGVDLDEYRGRYY